MYVEMTDNLGTRRNQSNTYFITIVSAIYIAFSITLEKTLIALSINIVQASISLIGILVCLTWILNIRSYKILAKAKFDTIHDLEKQLPVGPYTREWEYVKKTKYTRITATEMGIPYLFMLPFLTLLILTLI